MPQLAADNRTIAASQHGQPSGHKPEGQRSLRHAIEVVAEASGVSVREILSPRRAKRVAEARQAAMWLARRCLALSYPAIGRAFDRDHTTVIYGVSPTRHR